MIMYILDAIVILLILGGLFAQLEIEKMNEARRERRLVLRANTWLDIQRLD